MTILGLEILLHYASRATDYRDGDFSAPAVKDAIKSFMHPDVRLLELNQADPSNKSAKYRLTGRGEFYVEALKRMPLPEQRWYIPQDQS